jgi:hypothetical protein
MPWLPCHVDFHVAFYSLKLCHDSMILFCAWEKTNLEMDQNMFFGESLEILSRVYG